jgi:hypothetical protein
MNVADRVGPVLSAILLVSAIGSGNPREPRTVKTPETLAQVMHSIHKQILKAGHRFPWLANYSDQCLSKPSSIFYMPPLSRSVAEKQMPQQPDQMGLSLIPTKTTKGFKYFNLFERIPQCTFKRYGLKLYGNVVDWDAQREPVISFVKRTVVQECTKWHRLHGE